MVGPTSWTRPSEYVLKRDSLAEAAASSRVHAYNKLAARIEELGLPAAVDAKPVLDVSSFPSHPS